MSEAAYPLWSPGAEPRLVASRRLSTGELTFPAVPAASPLASQYEQVPVPAVGHVYSFTVIHPGPKSGEQPYALGYVDFPGPLRIFGRLTGTPRPQIGARYQARADDRFGYAFEALDR